MTNEIRVRYAPSPTGHLHIGNARTPYLIIYLLEIKVESLLFELRIPIKNVILKVEKKVS